jgi:hypothetical protein
MALKCGNATHCNRDAPIACTNDPKLCGSCCRPSCSNHGGDKKTLKRGRSSIYKRRRECCSFTLSQVLSNALGQIPGMQEALQDRRESLRQLARNVVVYVINSIQQTEDDTKDPLAMFPAQIRDVCVDVFDDVIQQQGADQGISVEQQCQALLPRLHSDPMLEAIEDHVQSESSSAGQPRLVSALEWCDGGYVMHGEPGLEVLVEELDDRRKAEVRLAIWRRLHCPSYKQLLNADLQGGCVQPKAFELMRSHKCPLGFADSDEYHAFMSELCGHIWTRLSELCGKTEARHHHPSLNGFWIILGGSAARLYSEGRFLEEHRDAESIGEITCFTKLHVHDKDSDVNISIVLDVPDVSDLVQKMFGLPGHGYFTLKQVQHWRVHELFRLKTFVDKWTKTLSRTITVLLPRTSAACRDRWSWAWRDAFFWQYQGLGPLQMHQGPHQPPTTREAPAAASSSRSPPLAPITCDALTASSITVITVPSSSVQFLVPRDGKNNETSHYKRDVPKMWRPWGKLTGTKVLKDL